MKTDTKTVIDDIEKDIDLFKSNITELKYRAQILEKDVTRLEADLTKLGGTVITKEKFAPYEKFANAIGIAVALAVVGAIMASILK
ncbi:MAG: hypothetical protein WCJ60_03425 [bacterium]